MKKLFILTTLLLLATKWCVAQLTLQPLVPQSGLFTRLQLWNILVANGTSGSLDCYLVLSLQDRESGTEVWSATTNTFTLDKGAKQLNNASLTPIQYSSLSDPAGDFLPVGSYTACYKLIGSGHAGSNSVLAEACLPFEVAPLSPPMLISPADSAVLPQQPAQFTWQPPAPQTMFSQLHYEMVVAEIQPGQTPEEAVELNAPFYMDLNVPFSFLNYTGTYPVFEKGKWYAWQVVAQDGRSYAAKTPAWDFKIDSIKVPPPIVANGNYIVLKNEKEGASGVQALTGHVLGIKYYSYEKEHPASVRFLDPGGKIIWEVQEKIVYGDNLFSYKLEKIFKKGTVYKVEISDSRNNKSFSFFVLK